MSKSRQPDCSRCEHRSGPFCGHVQGGGYPGRSVAAWVHNSLTDALPERLRPDNCPLTGAPASVVGWEVEGEFPTPRLYVTTQDYSRRCLTVTPVKP